MKIYHYYAEYDISIGRKIFYDGICVIDNIMDMSFYGALKKSIMKEDLHLDSKKLIIKSLTFLGEGTP